MASSSTLINQLAMLGINLPPWPEEVEGDCTVGDWIQHGRAYAEVVRLWRAQLRNAPESTKAVVDQLVSHLQGRSELGVWDQLVYGAIKPEVQGSPDFDRWQTCTKLTRLSALTPAQLLGMALELAREQRVGAATYCLKQLLKEHAGISSMQRLEMCSELISNASTGILLSQANTNMVYFDLAVKLHRHLADLLATAMAEEVSQNVHTIDDSKLLSKLYNIINCMRHEDLMIDSDAIKNSFMKTWKIEVDSYKDEITSEALPSSPPDYLFIYAGHIRSLIHTRKSHSELINHGNTTSSVSIMHTWNTQYPETISWRGHIQHDNQCKNDDLIDSIRSILPDCKLLSVDKQRLDPDFLNREEHDDKKIEGMHYGSRFFRFSRLYSIYMALHYVEKYKIPKNTKVIILRPDVEFKHGMNISNIFSNEMKSPFYLYNKKGNDVIYKATDCVWFCFVSDLKSIYTHLLDPALGIISMPQQYFLPLPNGCYNKTWGLYR